MRGLYLGSYRTGCAFGDAGGYDYLQDALGFSQLPGRKGYPKGTLFVRPLSMWDEIIDHQGKKTPRFSLVSQ